MMTRRKLFGLVLACCVPTPAPRPARFAVYDDMEIWPRDFIYRSDGCWHAVRLNKVEVK